MGTRKEYCDTCWKSVDIADSYRERDRRNAAGALELGPHSIHPRARKQRLKHHRRSVRRGELRDRMAVEHGAEVGADDQQMAIGAEVRFDVDHRRIARGIVQL